MARLDQPVQRSPEDSLWQEFLGSYNAATVWRHFVPNLARAIAWRDAGYSPREAHAASAAGCRTPDELAKLKGPAVRRRARRT
jgi:hypothetical protein